uniref:DUF834 domain-containing protein n=1 Tax=Oryza nivara TaxID=4536 RepID=A0A0E0G649_ORYNI
MAMMMEITGLLLLNRRASSSLSRCRALLAAPNGSIRTASTASSDEGGDGGGGEAGGEVGGGYSESPVTGVAGEGPHLGAHEVVGLRGGAQRWPSSLLVSHLVAGDKAEALLAGCDGEPPSRGGGRHGRRKEGRGSNRRRKGGHGQGCADGGEIEGKKMVGPTDS